MHSWYVFTVCQHLCQTVCHLNLVQLFKARGANNRNMLVLMHVVLYTSRPIRNSDPKCSSNTQVVSNTRITGN